MSWFASSHRAGRPGRRIGVALAALTVGVLAACQPTTAGAAAIVGNHRLGESSVQQDVAALLAERGGSDSATGELKRATVQRWVYGEILQAAAAERGVKVTARQVRDQRAALVARNGQAAFRQAVLASGVPTRAADELLRLVVTQDALASALVPDTPGADPVALGQARQEALARTLGAKARQLQIQVNPRYGAFDVSRGAVVPLASGGLAVPAGSGGAG